MKYYVTEFIGAFFLTLTVALSGGSDLAPLAIGAALMIMVYAGGYISGGHYNPAVSTAVALSGNLDKIRMRGYLIAQILGALIASVTANLMTGQVFAPAPTGSIFFAPLIAEVLCTFALCYVVLHTALAKETKGNSYYGLAIGSTIMIGAVIAGPISGGVFNPAIGIGSFLANLLQGGTMTASAAILYIIGPVLGAVLADVVYSVQKN